jgi:hypothetical protein
MSHIAFPGAFAVQPNAPNLVHIRKPKERSSPLWLTTTSAQPVVKFSGYLSAVDSQEAH